MLRTLLIIVLWLIVNFLYEHIMSVYMTAVKHYSAVFINYLQQTFSVNGNSYWTTFIACGVAALTIAGLTKSRLYERVNSSLSIILGLKSHNENDTERVADDLTDADDTSITSSMRSASTSCLSRLHCNNLRTNLFVRREFEMIRSSNSTDSVNGSPEYKDNAGPCRNPRNKTPTMKSLCHQIHKEVSELQPQSRRNPWRDKERLFMDECEEAKGSGRAVVVPDEIVEAGIYKLREKVRDLKSMVDAEMTQLGLETMEREKSERNVRDCKEVREQLRCRFNDLNNEIEEGKVNGDLEKSEMLERKAVVEYLVDQLNDDLVMEKKERERITCSISEIDKENRNKLQRETAALEDAKALKTNLQRQLNVLNHDTNEGRDVEMVPASVVADKDKEIYELKEEINYLVKSLKDMEQQVNNWFVAIDKQDDVINDKDDPVKTTSPCRGEGSMESPSVLRASWPEI